MRLSTWLTLPGLLLSPLVSPALAQKDSVFKNVEYLSGSPTLGEKQKGKLIVSATDVRLVDKKGVTYLVIPMTTIRKATDSTFEVGAVKKKLSSLLGNSGPESHLRISTGKDSVEQVIVFKTHEERANQQIASLIKAHLDGTIASSAAANEQAAAGEEAPLPLLIVANPYVEMPADSEAAVKVGTAMRDEIKGFVDGKLQVVTREQMNKALEPYGYPADAILSPSLAVTLAKSFQAPVLVSGTMKKGDDGKYAVSASLAGVDDPSPKPVTVTQKADESLEAFGKRVAEELKGAPQETAQETEQPAPKKE